MPWISCWRGLLVIGRRGGRAARGAGRRQAARRAVAPAAGGGGAGGGARALLAAGGAPGRCLFPVRRRAMKRRCLSLLGLLLALAPARGRGPGVGHQPGHDPDHLQLYRQRYRGVRRHRASRKAAQGRDIVVVVRGPDEPMTVRRRDRVAGVWVNRDAAQLRRPARLLLSGLHRAARRASPRARRWRAMASGCRRCTRPPVGSHHDPEPFRQAAIRYHQRERALCRKPRQHRFSQRDPVPHPRAGAGRA